MPDQYNIHGEKIHGRVYKTFKRIGFLLLLIPISFLVIRSIFSAPSDVNDLLITDEVTLMLVEGREITAYKFNRNGSFGGGRIFHISNVVYIESDQTLQFTLRYNIKKTDKLTEGYYDYEDKSSKYPALKLILSDSKGYEDMPLYKYISSSSYLSHKGNSYYERIIFENVNIDYTDTELKLSVYLTSADVSSFRTLSAETKVFSPNMNKKKITVSNDYGKITRIYDTKR